MRKPFLISLTKALVAGLLLASCASPTLPQGTDPSKGTIHLRIPAIATWLASPGQSSSTTSGSRALAVADMVRLTVRDSLGATVDTWSQSVSATPSSQELSPPVGHGAYAPGTYTLGIEVFNQLESTSVPTVAGTSAPFTISAGASTPVGITCLPTAPQSLTYGSASSGVVLGAPWTYGTGGTVLSHGGEKWFSFTASSANTKVTLTPGSPSVLVMYAVFDSAGLLVGQTGGDGFVAGSTRSLAFSTTVGSLYYLVAANGGGPASSESETATILVETTVPTTTVSGTITLPADATGKPFEVYLKHQSGEGQVVSGVVSGSLLDYSFSAIPVGTPYLVYAVVDLTGQWKLDNNVVGNYLGGSWIQSLTEVNSPPDYRTATGSSEVVDLQAFLIPTNSGTEVTPTHTIIVPNGDFETAQSIWLSGATEDTQYAFSLDAGSHEGSSAGLLDLTNDGYAMVENETPFLQVDEDGTYNLSLWAKASGSPSYLYIAVWKASAADAPFEDQVLVVDTFVDPTVDYSKFILNNVVLKQGDYLRFEIGVENNSGSDVKVWIDDLRLFR